MKKMALLEDQLEKDILFRLKNYTKLTPLDGPIRNRRPFLWADPALGTVSILAPLASSWPGPLGGPGCPRTRAGGPDSHHSPGKANFHVVPHGSHSSPAATGSSRTGHWPKKGVPSVGLSKSYRLFENHRGKLAGVQRSGAETNAAEPSALLHSRKPTCAPAVMPRKPDSLAAACRLSSGVDGLGPTKVWKAVSSGAGV